MMKISVDPAGLTKAQREAVAGFILAYPINEQCVDEGCPQAKTVHICVDKELEVLANEAGAPVSPAQAFGITPAMDSVTEAAAAFGPAATVPNPPLQAHQVEAATFGCANHAPVIPPAAPGVDVDSTGLPWDKRIHAEGKAKIANGTWRKKRNVDPALVATVEAELRGVMSAPAAPVTPGPVPLPPGVSNTGAVVTALPAAPPAPAPAAPVVSLDARKKYVDLIGRASAAIQSGKLSQAEISQVCNDFGVGALVLLANRLDLVDSVAYAIDALIALKG